MSGVENIINCIIEESRAKADAIITSAQNEADRILSVCIEENAKTLLEQKNKADIECLSFFEKEKTTIERELSQKTLFNKQLLIDKTIEIAYKKLLNITDEDYVEFVYRKIKELSDNPTGVIKFASKIPDNVKRKVCETIKKNYPGIEISDEEVKSDGGFVLINGKIEENWTFEMLFESNMNLIKDKVNTLLFEGEN